jgi:ClpP class serine protease
MIRSDLTYAMAAGKPMLIDPLKVKSFLANANIILNNPDLAYMLSQYSAPEAYEPKARSVRRPRADFDEPAPTADSPSSVAKDCSPYVRDGIGIIPVYGVIGKGLTTLEKMLGCADVDVISLTLDDWKDREDIYEVVFHIDSGGGSTTGLEELAKKIRNYQKPTVAFTDSDCGSAAFWIGSQCKRLVCTPSSSVGACGVYITLTDSAEKFAKAGEKVVVIKSGRYKAAGVEGTTLSEEQEANLQEEVNELHRRFVRDVQSVRTFADIEDLQGQSFYGDLAAQRGLATGVIDSLEDLIKEIKETRRFAHHNTLPTMYGSTPANNPVSINHQPYIG